MSDAPKTASTTASAPAALPPANPPPKVRLVGRVVLIAVTIALTVAAMFFWQRLSEKQKPAQPPPPGPIPVQVVAVRAETVPTYPRFLGQTEGSQVVNVRARVSGYLVDRNFKEGERVKKGQPLFRIDPRPFEASLNIAKAKQVSAEATLARAQSQIKRYKELLAKGSTTTGEFEDVERDERVAAASVQETIANVDSAALELEYTTITAPLDGVIGQALKDVGNYVDSSQAGEVAEIQAVDPIYVKFSITEQEILRVQKRIDGGQLISPPIDRLHFKLTLSDGSDYPQIASLNYADVKIDSSTGSGVVRGTAPNSDGKLKPGMFVYATILDQQLANVIRIPQAAVVQSPAGASVLLMNDEGVVELRPVTLGEWSGDQWIITQGIKVGEQVIIDRLPLLRPGMPVVRVPSPLPKNEQQTPETPRP